MFGPFVEEYLADLKRDGHPEPLRLHHLSLVRHFGEFVATKGVRHVDDVRPDHLSAFLRYERRRRAAEQRRRESTATYKISAPTRLLGRFLRYLEGNGHWQAPQVREPPPIASFFRALEIDRGLSRSTIHLYRLFLGKLLDHLECDGSSKSLVNLSARDVDGFLVAAGQTYSRKSMSSVGAVVRAFLRHLFREGILKRDLAPCVTLPHFYALERLPCALPWSTVRRLLRIPDLQTATGLRDRAIFALLVSYGVRPGEIVSLRLDDIDWRHDTIRFRRSKPGRALAFPMTREAGNALQQYLRRGRPRSEAREVFLRCLAPYRALAGGHVVSTRVGLYLVKAGIESRKKGAGVIRHSLAVHFLRKGHPLKTITDVLGHRDPGVAYHYAKLATEDLRGVALDGRGVLP